MFSLSLQLQEIRRSSSFLRTISMIYLATLGCRSKVVDGFTSWPAGPFKHKGQMFWWMSPVLSYRDFDQE